MILTVPRDRELYPTLGWQVCDFIEQNLTFGPGDLRGQPVVLDDEKRALIYRVYEVFPKKHPRAGRRRFKRAGISLTKGLGKTELAAWIAACELHHEAPVRCVGWTKNGEPIGGPVDDPYISVSGLYRGAVGRVGVRCPSDHSRGGTAQAGLRHRLGANHAQAW